MKKFFRKTIKPLQLLPLVLFLASCNFSDDTPVFTPLPVVPDLPVTLTANFNIDKSTPQPLMDILPQTNTAATNADRSATASMPSNTQLFVQAVTVNEAVPLTVNVPDDDIDTTNNRFTINLLTGHKWGITVGIKDTDINETILYDYYEKELSATNTDMTHDFALKPHITSGLNGKIHLEINLADSAYAVSIEDEANAYTDWNSHLTTSGPTRTLDITSIPSGIYVLKITFSKTNSIPFTATQTVTVYDYLLTNKWVSGGNAFIDDTGTFLLSNQIIAAANSGKKIYYVDGNVDGAGSNSNSGNFNSPLQTVKRAVELINAVGNTTDIYKIYVKHGTIETNGSPIQIGNTDNTRKIEIKTYKTTPTDGDGAVTLTRNVPLSVINIQTGSSLTIDGGLTIDGAHRGANGVYINNTSTFTMNNGIIQNCDNAGVSNYGIFNFYGGSITDNTSSASENAGGIYMQTDSQINIKGNVNVYNNFLSDGTTSSNVYLPTGIYINIVDTLDSSSRICVTTAGVPHPSMKKITNGYSAHNSIPAGTIFKGDIYGVKQIAVEAYLAASGGALTERYSDDVQIQFEGPATVWTGTSASATISVTKNGTAITSPALTLDAFKSFGSSYNSDTYRTFSGNTITLPNSLAEGRYTATVSTVINGTKYSGSKTFNVVPKEVEVSSGNFNTSATLTDSSGFTSQIFIQNRLSVANIRPLIASTHEVTQKEYEQYCSYTTGIPNRVPTITSGKSDEYHDYPAYYVNWYDTVLYCNLRTLNDSTFGSTRADRLTHCVYAMGGTKDPANWTGLIVESGKYHGPDEINTAWDSITFDVDADGWRLPTCVEWEYLARGGNLSSGSTQTIYSGSNNIDDVAWNHDNAENKTHEVCTKSPNGLGLYDMSGNVNEWCWDKETLATVDADTPATGPDDYGSEPLHVTCGGDHFMPSYSCKINTIGNSSSEYRSNTHGFRVVRNAQ